MNSKSNKYGVGVVVPVVTPLKQDLSVDQDGLEKVIRNCIDAGVSGIFVLGSAGEGICHGQEEREKVISVAGNLTGDVIPLYVGVMDSSTNRVKESIKQAEARGADIVVVTPHYYLRSRNQDEIVRHVELCADSTSVPIVIYNNPGTTYVNIAIDTLGKIMQIESVIGIKESSGDFKQFQEELDMTESEGFRLLVGGQPILGVALLAGADGCVSGIANYAPKLIVELYSEAKDGNLREVLKLQRKVMELDKATHAGDFFLAGIKYACVLMGLCEEHLCEPFEVLTEPQKHEVEDALVQEGILEG